MHSRRSFCALASGVTGIALVAACSSTLLPPATLANVVDTVTLYALGGTPLGTPSAYSIAGRTPVRIELGTSFDFAFDFDALGHPVLVPAGVYPGLLTAKDTTVQAGFQPSATPFASVTLAPREGYEVVKPFAVDSDAVVLARSHFQGCVYGFQGALYAKLHVLGIDPVARTIRLEILADQNCGYFGLAPGIPGQ